MFKRIDKPMGIIRQSSISPGKVPKVITRIRNVVRGIYGTFTMWAVPPHSRTALNGSTCHFDTVVTTAYHVTKASPMPGASLSTDTLLGRLSTQSRIQDWITLPTRAALMLPSVQLRPWVTQQPTAHERVWVVRGSCPTPGNPQMPIEMRCLPYQVQFKIGSFSAHWFYIPLREGHETIPGDSGCPVLTDQGILIGFNVAHNVFTSATSVIPEAGHSSWIDAHHSFGKTGATISNQQCALNSLWADIYPGQTVSQQEGPELIHYQELLQHNATNQAETTAAHIIDANQAMERHVNTEAPSLTEEWPSPQEMREAACRMNQRIPASVETIMNTSFTRDNIDFETVRERPYKPTTDPAGNDIRDRIHGCYVPNVQGKPRPDLIYGEFTFSSDLHGDFIKMIALRFTGKKALRVRLTGDAIHQAILWWITIATEDIRNAASTKVGGRRKGKGTLHRCRALQWIIPAAAFRSNNIISAVNYISSKGTAPFELVTGTKLPRQRFDFPLLLRYEKMFTQHDKQALLWLKHGAAMGAEVPRNSVMATNHKSFFSEIDWCVSKQNEEMEWGCTRGYSQSPYYYPFIFESYGYVFPDRKVCDRGLHAFFDFEGAGVSANAWERQENTEIYHPPILPTPKSHAINIQIILTLTDVMANVSMPASAPMHSSFDTKTGFTLGRRAYRTVSAGADMSHMFRLFAVPEHDEHTQHAIVNPKGVTVDSSCNYGDALVLGSCMRMGNIKLRLTTAIVILIIEEFSAWNGHTIRHRRGDWDSHPLVQKWRQARYQKARDRGLDHKDAMRESIPLSTKLYVDDDMIGIIEIFEQLFFSVLFDFAKQSKGYLISCHKTQKTGNRPGTLVSMDKQGQWLPPQPGHYKGLGKLFDLERRCLFDTAERYPQLLAAVDVIKQERGKFHKPLCHLLSAQKALGIAQFIASTEPGITGLLQYPLRSLSVRTGLAQSSNRAPGHGVLAPCSDTTMQAWELILVVAKANTGVAFLPDASFPLPHNTIVIYNDAAGYSKEDPHSFRGGCSIISIPGSHTTKVSIIPWTPQQLQNHSTTLEMVNGNRPLFSILKDTELTAKFTNIIECYDNSAVVNSSIRLGASSLELRHLLLRRTRRLLQQGVHIRLFSLWRRRDVPCIAMCDAGSKGELDELDTTLTQLGLPRREDIELPRPIFPADDATKYV